MQNELVAKHNTSSQTLWQRLGKDIGYNYDLYLLILPVVAYYIIFHYVPMYGAVIAFQDYVPSKGILGSEWVGFKHFETFFNSYYFWRILKNTVVISVSTIIFGFPAPIILAILINELRKRWFSRTVQTITYLPHFISLVVICGIIKDFTSNDGVIGALINSFTGRSDSLLNVADYFVPIYVISDIWQGVGWGSIVYLAALTGIDQELYEVASLDGAGRWKQTLHVTLPGIVPTIVIMLILKMGGIVNVGFEKIILLYSPATYDTADVISSFTYRKGLQEFNFSYSSAVGLFNSIINFVFLIASNQISRRFNETSLW